MENSFWFERTLTKIMKLLIVLHFAIILREYQRKVHSPTDFNYSSFWIGRSYRNFFLQVHLIGNEVLATSYQIAKQ